MEQLKENTYRLTYVDRGTYRRIAKELGYTEVYVAMVAKRQASNADIEDKLIEAVKRRVEREKQIQSLENM